MNSQANGVLFVVGPKGVNALVAQRLIDLLLCLKVDLLLIVIDPGKPGHHGLEVFIEHRRLVYMCAGHHIP